MYSLYDYSNYPSASMGCGSSTYIMLVVTKLFFTSPPFTTTFPLLPNLLFCLNHNYNNYSYIIFILLFNHHIVHLKFGFSFYNTARILSDKCRAFFKPWFKFTYYFFVLLKFLDFFPHRYWFFWFITDSLNGIVRIFRHLLLLALTFIF